MNTYGMKRLSEGGHPAQSVALSMPVSQCTAPYQDGSEKLAFFRGWGVVFYEACLAYMKPSGFDPHCRVDTGCDGAHWPSQHSKDESRIRSSRLTLVTEQV